MPLLSGGALLCLVAAVGAPDSGPSLACLRGSFLELRVEWCRVHCLPASRPSAPLPASEVTGGWEDDAPGAGPHLQGGYPGKLDPAMCPGEVKSAACGAQRIVSVVGKSQGQSNDTDNLACE